jgi:hypothetical protein
MTTGMTSVTTTAGRSPRANQTSSVTAPVAMKSLNTSSFTFSLAVSP